MPTFERRFLKLLSDMDNWTSYENSSNSRDISKLGGIKLLLKKLGNPEKNLKIIHIAGTIGKGSTATFISHLLKFQGFSTGCYTSPHLIDIRERIKINGESVSKKIFVDSASVVLRIASKFKGSPYLSYFDLLTAIALKIFMIEKMEWVVLEAGLGGQYDSTNVTSKELCILTKVGFDHQKILGKKLTDIAKEKIGITRSKIPIIISPQEDELSKWLVKKLGEKNVPFFFVEDFFKSQFHEKKISLVPSTKSRYENIATSLCAMQILFKENFPQKKKWLEILKNLKIPGRLDLKENIFWKKHLKYFDKILMDGAHNKDSINELNNFLTLNKITPFTLVLGMVSDKLVKSLVLPIKELCSAAENIILTPIPSPRTATTKMLEDFIFKTRELKFSSKTKHSSSVEDALELCLLYNNNPIVIAGSFYLVGEAMKILKN